MVWLYIYYFITYSDNIQRTFRFPSDFWQSGYIRYLLLLKYFWQNYTVIMTFLTENKIANISEYIVFVVERKENRVTIFFFFGKTKIDSNDNHTTNNLNAKINIGRYCVLSLLIILSYENKYICIYNIMFNYQHGLHWCLFLLVF